MRFTLSLISIFILGHTSFAESNPFAHFGGNREWEFLTNFSQGSFTSQGSTTNMNAVVSANKYLNDQFQAGAEVGVNSRSGGGSSYTLLTVAGIGTYNFQNSLPNSFYAKAGVGMFGVQVGSGSENKFGFLIGGGKRFLLIDRLSYSPEVRYTKITDVDATLAIQFLNFSLFY